MFANKLRSALSLTLLTAMVAFGVSSCGAEADGDNASETQGTGEHVAEQASAITPTDIRWALQHAAASAACAADSPENDSAFGHIIIAKPNGGTCTAACAANTGGSFTFCRTSIAVGTIRTTQATAYTDILGYNYRYSCSAGLNGMDEVQGVGADTGMYTAYCCCYH